MELKPGSRWRSAVCDTEVIVVRAPSGPVDLRCGGHPVLPQGEEATAGGALDEAHSNGTPMGKRYADPESGLELLCTKAGAGSLSLGDTPMALKDAKPLPASD